MFKFQGNSDTIKENDSNSRQISQDGKSKGSDNINRDLDNILRDDNPKHI